MLEDSLRIGLGRYIHIAMFIYLCLAGNHWAWRYDERSVSWIVVDLMSSRCETRELALNISSVGRSEVQ
jgi:hypothetical protein